jgi:single-strand DNA-binding protein
MASFNKVILLGNLTRDPQVRYTPSGMAVADIGLAVNHSWFDKQTNQRREEATFVDVTLWGRTAEIAGEYLGKGRQVLIEGRLQLDQWDDRETGQKRSKLKVVCENLTMVGSRAEGHSQDVRGAGGPPSQASETSEGSYNNQAPAEPSGGFDAPPPGSGEGDVPF